MSSNFAPNQVEDIVSCVKRLPNGRAQLSAKGRDPVAIDAHGLSEDLIREHFVEPFCAQSLRGTTIIVSTSPEPWEM